MVEPPPISETSLPISFSNRASQPSQLPVEHSGQQQPVTPSTLTVASAPNLAVAKAPPVVAKSYNASTNRVDVESFVPETRSDFDSFLDDETSAGSNSGLGNNILDSRLVDPLGLSHPYVSQTVISSCTFSAVFNFLPLNYKEEEVIAALLLVALRAIRKPSASQKFSSV